MKKPVDRPAPTGAHWLEQPANAKTLWRGFLCLLVLSVLAGLFVDLHPHFDVEHWPGFHAGYGFGACLLMIVGAKALGVILARSDRDDDATDVGAVPDGGRDD